MSLPEIAFLCQQADKLRDEIRKLENHAAARGNTHVVSLLRSVGSGIRSSVELLEVVEKHHGHVFASEGNAVATHQCGYAAAAEADDDDTCDMKEVADNLKLNDPTGGGPVG